MPVKKKSAAKTSKVKKSLGKRDLEFFRKMITKQKQELQTKLEVLRETAVDSTVKSGAGENSSYAFHMADLGTDSQEREKAFLFVSREGQYLDKLEATLKRINAGTFGICRTCMNVIDKERLMAVPITTQCVKCKTNKA